MKNILIHGLGQTPASWEKTIAAMGKQEDISCPDIKGLLQGREAEFANLYGAFSAYCGAAAQPLNLCGLSLGGILALQYGAEHPEKVNSLILIGTQYTMPKGLLKFQNVIFGLMPQKAFQGMGFGKREMIGLSKSMMDLDFREALGEIKCPVLIVCGEKDSANKRASVEMREKIPHAELALIEGAGHEVNMDAPGQLGELLGQFWGKVIK